MKNQNEFLTQLFADVSTQIDGYRQTQQIQDDTFRKFNRFHDTYSNFMKYFLNETIANEYKAQTMIKKKVTTQRMVETLINDLMDMAKFDNDKF